MWASLPEKAGDAGGSICCLFTAHIVGRPGMPLSHLFILSHFFASIRFQKHIWGFAQSGIWQCTHHAFSLPSCLLQRQQTGLLLTLLSGKTKSLRIIFSLLFSKVGVSFLCYFFISTEVITFNQYCALTFLTVPLFILPFHFSFMPFPSLPTWHSPAGHVKHQVPWVMLDHGGSGQRQSLWDKKFRSAQRLSTFSLWSAQLVIITAGCPQNKTPSIVLKPWLFFSA